MDPAWQSVVDDLLIRLAALQSSRPDWAPRFDVHSREVQGRVDQLLEVPSFDVAQIDAILRDPGPSFRAVADTQVAIACWLYLNGCKEIRELLCKTLAPWGGLVTLLANLSGRLFFCFESTGDSRWARLALAAIALLGDNADPREDARFMSRVWTALMKRGHDAPSIFNEFSAITEGQAHALFVGAAGNRARGSTPNS